ncbi:galactosylgalactosylxylosylprotein 3-beta-glucuronosyltransferase 1-like isoform X1 [Lethenteron reissneri]|uniref:galactosylgalactosylxylosylprotein 3-beta-glucuronosyltransferase 1-like isoform X1 n=2 Tax=Lethenteron reissneri TaxID=7753 RepID=UPI002AB5FB76|nr:galactosylgalactosylxylosylprotein 3-beta-glucuronosyltransferase 1-like isoform X1 [Lethenteron reissneri]
MVASGEHRRFMGDTESSKKPRLMRWWTHCGLRHAQIGLAALLFIILWTLLIIILWTKDTDYTIYHTCKCKGKNPQCNTRLRDDLGTYEVGDEDFSGRQEMFPRRIKSSPPHGLNDTDLHDDDDTNSIDTSRKRWRRLCTSRWDPALPVIFAVTPTYARATQKADLTRLSHTMALVPNLHWLVVEDAPAPSALVSAVLRNAWPLSYTHLHMETPKQDPLKPHRSRSSFPRGTFQRNEALRWLREMYGNRSRSHDSTGESGLDPRALNGVVYFADDDNTYSMDIFEEMRHTTNVSVWPVAFVGGMRYESVVVGANGVVTGWKVAYDPTRSFAIDMAGFAINLNLLLQNSKAYFNFHARSGNQESSLLEQLVTRDQLEPKADNCTKVLVWHTRTSKPIFQGERGKGFSDPNVEV